MPEHSPSPTLEPSAARPPTRALLHASLLTADAPLSLDALATTLQLEPNAVEQALQDLASLLEHQALGVMLEQVAQGYRLVIEPHVARWLEPARNTVRSSLSQAALETLALIAYHQPLTRSQLEQLRGTSCSSTLDTLQERALIQVVGQSDSLGKPNLYGTTQRFLVAFGLNALEDLPSLETPNAFVRS